MKEDKSSKTVVRKGCSGPCVRIVDYHKAEEQLLLLPAVWELISSTCNTVYCSQKSILLGKSVQAQKAPLSQTHVKCNIHRRRTSSRVTILGRDLNSTCRLTCNNARKTGGSTWEYRKTVVHIRKIGIRAELKRPNLRTLPGQ